MQPKRHPRAAAGPILVLDPIARHTVGAVRGLGRAGWDVVVAGAERKADALAARSRYAEAPYERLPDPHGPPAPFAAALADLLDRRGCQAIVVVSDSTIARLEQIGPPVPVVPRLDGALDRIIDKVNLAAVCDAAAVRYPTTWLPGAPPASAAWPRIVKPRRTSVTRSDRVVGRTGALVVADLAEEDAAVEELRGLELEPIIQTRVERAFKVNVSIVRHRGRTTFRIAYRVLLEFPPKGGQAAAIESVDPHSGRGAEALALAERVCDAARFEGLANVEFYGQQDGSLCLIEINPRVWGSVWFPERLGLRPVERAVLAALDEDPPAPIEYRPGRRFHRPTLEARWLLAPAVDRASARQLPAILRPWDVYDLLSITDPLPFAAGLRRMLVRSGDAISPQARARPRQPS